MKQNSYSYNFAILELHVLQKMRCWFAGLRRSTLAFFCGLPLLSLRPFHEKTQFISTNDAATVKNTGNMSH